MKMKNMFSLFILFLFCRKNVISQQTIFVRNYISCEEKITDTINESESHYYQLEINNQYDVNMDACLSSTDIIVKVYYIQNQTAYYISNEYCYGGDWCGLCRYRNNLFPENFTMPQMIPGKYLIGIAPYTGYSGIYEFNVHCINVSIPSYSPNTTLTYTTSVMPEFDSTIECDYYSDNYISTSSSQTILSSIIF
eukprot:79019_1